MTGTRSLHWRAYREEIIGETYWLPSIEFYKCPYKHYFRELSIYWLKWGFSFRWWWRNGV